MFDRKGWSWLVLLLLAVFVIGVCAWFFLVRLGKMSHWI